ncbi:MAG: hypothetical protein HY042_01885 [Spirochaetia bacterium]|nr:hypothetical protein [Spirochaetia bacterium]
MELRKYITAYDRFSARYVQSPDEDRPEILSEFSKYLTHHPADRLRRFKIVSQDRERSRDGEVIDGGRAFVKVQADREANGYNVTYEYTYTLEKADNADGFWRIVFVSARVLR